VLWLPEAARRRLLSIGSVPLHQSDARERSRAAGDATAIDKLGGRGIAITEAEHLFKEHAQERAESRLRQEETEELENDQLS